MRLIAFFSHSPSSFQGEALRSSATVIGRRALQLLSAAMPGYPFVTLLPYALDGRGAPLFLISSLAEHTRNLQADPRASLLVAR